MSETLTGPAPDPMFVELQQGLAGRYSLISELGRGGMGIVYLARQVRLDRLVAIKVLPPDRASPAQRARFLREARTAAKLSQPNIVPIHEVDEVGAIVYFVMAYVDGESLAARLAQRRSLSPGEAARLLREVAWALAYAHAHGVVHRDIKPDNILVERGTGRPMIADFGIAHLAEGSASTGPDQVLGTPDYMSPEQASGEAVDARTDIYSLGVVGYLALSGALPFTGGSVSAVLAQHITQPAPPLLRVAPGVPARLAGVVDRCLRKAPGERYPNAEALAEAIESAVERPRQLPAPLERWLASGDELRLRHVAVAPLVSTPVLAMISLALGAMPLRNGVPLSDTAMLIAGIVGPLTVYGVRRLWQTRELRRQGFSVDDIRMAVRAWAARVAEHRAEEPADSRGLRILRWIAESGAGVGLVVLGVGITRSCASGGDDPVNPLLYGTYTAVGAVLVVARIARGPGRNLSEILEKLRQRFWNAAPGRLLARISGLGVGRVVPQLAHRPTEIALGSAAAALFEALPREIRQELKDVPEMLRRLEARAGTLRTRIDELTAVEAAGAEDPRRADPAALAGRRQALQGEARAAREQAERLLADVVTALETVRIDLLRLKAGAVNATSISADLAAARQVGEAMDAAAEGQEGVERLLLTRPTPV